jgi:aminoglycoside phosphotransferase (APT) family kinase protein
MDEATSENSVVAFVEQVLDGSGWELASVRRRSTRLDPPNWFWATFAVDINKKDEERSLRLVAKGALNPEAWEKLSSRLVAHGAGRRCDPIDGIGYPVLFPETQHAYWFYPFDPSMTNLPLAADPVRMAGVLMGQDRDLADVLATSRRIDIERVRYTPEVGAILRYRLDTPGSPILYGKVQPGHRGLRTYRVVEGLWRAAARYPGLLHLPRPLGYVEEFGLLLEEGVRGKPVSSNRKSTDFMLAANAAAEALAVIHESGVEADERIDIEAELARLDRVAEQFRYVLPGGHFLLVDLITHMRDRVRKTREEDWLPTHGDLKYDQFVFHNDQFTLLDFDYFAVAETSYDLGKYCAYVFASSPKDWSQSVAAEEARELFIRRYRELRPNATLQRFGVYEALQFALRAMAFMWSQTRDWDRIAESLLVMGFERLKSRLPE